MRLVTRACFVCSLVICAVTLVPKTASADWSISKTAAGRDIIAHCRQEISSDNRTPSDPDSEASFSVGWVFSNWDGLDAARIQSALPGFESNVQQGGLVKGIVCALKRRLWQLEHPAEFAPTGAIATEVKPAPKGVAAAEKLPKARPAKTLPWSPKALSTDGSKLDPKFAAERADMLASCAVPIQQFGAAYTLTNGAANLLVEAGNLNDDLMALSAEVFKNHVLVLEKKIADGGHGARDIAAARAGRCVFLRRIAQLEGSPLISGAVDGTLTPLSIGGVGPPSKGIDPHIIAGNGKSAMHCVSLETTGSGDSNLSAAVTGRRFVNHCDDEVEIEWCNTPECERESGNTWTVQPGRGWPVSSNGEVRWGACHGRDTASAVKFSQGLRFYCNAPTKK